MFRNDCGQYRQKRIVSRAKYNLKEYLLNKDAKVIKLTIFYLVNDIINMQKMILL